MEWTRLPPDDIEHVIAIMLCREYPSAVRIRPSVGDGGIDVLVPLAEGYDVYQIKSFSANLSGKQKEQIEASFASLLKYTQEHQLTVCVWHLTLPLDPTNENRLWLEETARKAKFSSDWRGLVYVESLAAKYPDVVDYYLRDGKERLQAAISELVSVMKLTDIAGGEMRTWQVADTSELLAKLHGALNRHDPHYWHEFTVSLRSERTLAPKPMLVCSLQHRIDKTYVTWNIYARFNEATIERPLTFNATISVVPGSELAQDLDEFRVYGTPFTAPEGSVTGTASLPGGVRWQFGWWITEGRRICGRTAAGGESASPCS